MKKALLIPLIALVLNGFAYSNNGCIIPLLKQPHPLIVQLEQIRMTLPNQLKNTKFNLHWIFKNKEAVELIIAEFSNSNSYYKSVWDFTMDYENYYLSLGNKLSLRWERVRDIPSRKNFVKLMSFECFTRGSP
jgi:hypothetical protein